MVKISLVKVRKFRLNNFHATLKKQKLRFIRVEN
jgi:hypothetical protein